jgi:ABC-2 type transport system ATP-binding protein
MSALELTGVSKSYGKRPAICKLSMKVNSGEIFGFLGPNGAGKTTTIRLLLGLLKPDLGEIRLLGQKLDRRIMAKVGFLPDVARIDGGFRGQEWLQYLAALQPCDPAFQRELCERLELSQGDLSRKISQYSRGMRQKLAIIQALQHRPALLIMDEPTEGLDPLAKRSLFDLVKEARQNFGATIFFSSHVLSEVEKLCDRVALIRNGKLIATDTIADLRERQLRRVEITLQTPSDSFLPALHQLTNTANLSHDNERIRLEWRGDLNPLLSLLNTHPVRDLIIEPTDLESIFLSYYK